MKHSAYHFVVRLDSSWELGQTNLEVGGQISRQSGTSIERVAYDKRVC